MLTNILRTHIQHRDERALLQPFAHDFAGYEEPHISEVLELARPYLPASGTEGEMVVSIGKAAYLARHGADGIIDISPFELKDYEGTWWSALISPLRTAI